ncbi:MAG TPA: SLBB domain-containing protein [Rhabdochlamydiaceae bacterium]|nr:SLBB domain-containing protein [Rhabdochlamydiaceae bacterium]
MKQFIPKELRKFIFDRVGFISKFRSSLAPCSRAMVTRSRSEFRDAFLSKINFRSSLGISLILLFVFGSCTNPPYRGEVSGPDEFVMDSYKIRDGKLSVLEMEGKEPDPFCCEWLDEYQDRIHEGDILHVAIYHPTRTDISSSVQAIGSSIGFRVTEGKILLPDLAAVKVDGLTLEEARKAIQDEYLKNIQDIEVFLAYNSRTERKVEIVGLTAVPALPVDGRMRLFEVLSLARILPTTNLFKSYVVRDGCLLPVDLYKLIKEGDMSQNVVMRGGDKIYLADATASVLMVLGEVGRPRVIEIPNGFMTLSQALAEAGGIQITGDRRYIQVIRGNIQCPKIYTLHWNHIIHLPCDSMLLIPGDIVYVAATPLTEWARFVNQIMPTLIGIDLIKKGVKDIGVNVNP